MNILSFCCYSIKVNQTQKNIPNVQLILIDTSIFKEPKPQSIHYFNGYQSQVDSEYTGSEEESILVIPHNDGRSRAYSEVHKLTNPIPLLNVKTKPHEEESFFSGDERKSIDAFSSDKEMPIIIAHIIPQECSGLELMHKKSGVSNDQDKCTTQGSSPCKLTIWKENSGNSKSTENIETPFVESVIKSTVMQSIRNFNYSESAVTLLNECRWSASSDLIGVGTCGEFWINTTPQDQLKILRASYDETAKSYEFEFAVDSVWWREWWDYVNWEFEEFTITENTTKKKNNIPKFEHPVLLMKPLNNKGTSGDDDFEEPTFTTVKSVSDWEISINNSLGKFIYT